MLRMQLSFITDPTAAMYITKIQASREGRYGIDVNYLDTCGYALRSGRAFVQSDYDNYRKVALVDSNAAENISGRRSCGEDN